MQWGTLGWGFLDKGYTHTISWVYMKIGVNSKLNIAKKLNTEGMAL